MTSDPINRPAASPTASTGTVTRSAAVLDHLGVTGPASFDVLSPRRCLELLGVATVGRVAFLGSAGPGAPAGSEALQLLPVNYRLVAGRLLLRVEESSSLAELTGPHDVVFEVDYLSPLTREGWSVVVRATSGPLTDPETLASPLLRTLVPWQCQGPRVWWP